MPLKFEILMFFIREHIPLEQGLISSIYHWVMGCRGKKNSITTIFTAETSYYSVSTIGCVYSIRTIILQSVWKTHFYSPVRRNALADDIQGKMNELIKVRLKKNLADCCKNSTNRGWNFTSFTLRTNRP